MKMLENLLPEVTSANHWKGPSDGAWINVAFTFNGLKKLGIPDKSLNSFLPEFKAGMVSQAEKLNDIGDSAPSKWDDPFGTDDLHVALALFAPDREAIDEALKQARKVYDQLKGISLLYELEVESPPDGRTHMGFTDGISNPAVEGSGIPTSNPETPVKPGEFIIGKENQKGHVDVGPQPKSLGNNGSYLVIRKLHMRVAAFRKFLDEKASNKEDKDFLIAKMIGRWPSGAPISLATEKDDPDLAKNPELRNNFLYKDDPRGFKCPVGSHIRRANPRDSLNETIADINIHRLLRRSTVYGPPLEEGTTEDDGQDRGIIFAGICTSLSRQYEFIKSTWLHDGNFVELSTEEDPIVGNKRDEGSFTIPDTPFRKRINGIPSFTVTKGGEYFFVPSISALKWIMKPNKELK